MVEVVTDDLTGEQLESGAQAIRFAVNDVVYQLDLGADSAKKFEEAIAPFVGAAVRVGKSGTKRNGKTVTGKSELTAIRQWAIDNGHTVSTRGRIPSAVTEAYRAAH